MEKIFNIGFIRILFTLEIIYFHLFCQPNTLFAMYPSTFSQYHNLTSHGYLGVEMFFIMAGFFLFFSTRKNISFKDFFVNKFVRLWVVPAFALLCFIILALFGLGDLHILQDILHLLLLKNTGLTLELYDNGTAWFVSVLFWVSAFYCYLATLFDKKYTNLLFVLLIYFSLVLLVNGTGGNFCEHYNMVNSFLNVGMLRGISEIGIGYLLGMTYSHRNFESKKINSLQFIIYSFLEIFLGYFCIREIFHHNVLFSNDLLYVILFTLLFYLFVLRRGIISKILDRQIFYNLGCYSYSIYIMQEVVFKVLNRTFWQHNTFIVTHPVLSINLSILCCLVIGILVYYLVEKNSKIIFNKIKKGGLND